MLHVPFQRAKHCTQGHLKAGPHSTLCKMFLDVPVCCLENCKPILPFLQRVSCHDALRHRLSVLFILTVPQLIVLYTWLVKLLIPLILLDSAQLSALFTGVVDVLRQARCSHVIKLAAIKVW